MTAHRLSFAVASTAFAALFLTPPAAAQDEGETLQIKREPAVLKPIDEYQIPLALQPARKVTMRSPVDGVVKNVLVELGKSANDQADLVTFDSALERLQLKRAEAAAEAGYPTKEIAEIEKEIAQLKLDRMAVRAPFAGQVTAVHVVNGASVKKGEPVIELSDNSQLIARVPVQRREVRDGDTIPLRIEDETTTGTIQVVLPAGESIGKLRPLFESLAEAVVEVRNDGNLVAGQTVYSDLVPRDPIVEVPNSAVETDADGNRTVFVLRKGYAAAVSVIPLGQVGDDRVYVSGRFAPGDDIVTESSQPLVDGARVLESGKESAVEGSSTGGSSPSRPTPRRSAPSTF